MSLSELTRRLAEFGFTGAAITDHNAFGYDTRNPLHLQCAKKCRKDYGVELYSGMEISCEDSFEEWGGPKEKEVHIGAIFLDSRNRKIQRMVKEQQQSRAVRAELMIGKIKGRGWNIISFDEMTDMYPNITLMHIARHVTDQKGNSVDAKEFLENHFLQGGDCYAPKNLVPVQEAIELIVEAGAIPVFNHPLTTLGFDLFESSFELAADRYVAMGLQAIEGYTKKIPPAWSRWIMKYDLDHGLRTFGGSDTHKSKDPTIYVRNVLDIIYGTSKNASFRQRLERQG